MIIHCSCFHPLSYEILQTVKLVVADGLMNGLYSILITWFGCSVTFSQPQHIMLPMLAVLLLRG